MSAVQGNGAGAVGASDPVRECKPQLLLPPKPGYQQQHRYAGPRPTCWMSVEKAVGWSPPSGACTK